MVSGIPRAPRAEEGGGLRSHVWLEHHEGEPDDRRQQGRRAPNLPAKGQGVVAGVFAGVIRRLAGTSGLKSSLTNSLVPLVHTYAISRFNPHGAKLERA